MTDCFKCPDCEHLEINTLCKGIIKNAPSDYLLDAIKTNSKDKNRILVEFIAKYAKNRDVIDYIIKNHICNPNIEKALIENPNVDPNVVKKISKKFCRYDKPIKNSDVKFLPDSPFKEFLR
ncbi:MAG: hypothetical protein M1331_00445 [Candidatus Marsarchaeota archaeon]|nr:hypothetical protein [Candidatus Marsarchaeota archaeon]MCL5105855.1 hypothetical protein [Candidatus Marsarchaeota archaeon]